MPPDRTISGIAHASPPTAIAAMGRVRDPQHALTPMLEQGERVSGSVRHAVCTRTPAARPAMRAPMTIARLSRAPEKQRLSQSDQGQARHVAHRPGSGEPESGFAARRSVAHTASDDGVRDVLKIENAASSATAPAIGDQIASDRASVRGDPSVGATACSVAFEFCPARCTPDSPGGCGWCCARSKWRSPSAKLIESMSSSDGARNGRCSRQVHAATASAADARAPVGACSDARRRNTFIQAAHPIALQIDRHVLIADRLQLAHDRSRISGSSARGSSSRRSRGARASSWCRTRQTRKPRSRRTVFGALDHAQLLVGDFRVVRNARRQTRRRGLVPGRQPGAMRQLADLRLGQIRLRRAGCARRTRAPPGGRAGSRRDRRRCCRRRSTANAALGARCASASV